MWHPNPRPSRVATSSSVPATDEKTYHWTMPQLPQSYFWSLQDSFNRLLLHTFDQVEIGIRWFPLILHWCDRLQWAHRLALGSHYSAAGEAQTKSWSLWGHRHSLGGQICALHLCNYRIHTVYVNCICTKSTSDSRIFTDFLSCGGDTFGQSEWLNKTNIYIYIEYQILDMLLIKKKCIILNSNYYYCVYLLL